MKTELHAWLRCLLLCVTLAYGAWRIAGEMATQRLLAFQESAQLVEAVEGAGKAAAPPSEVGGILASLQKIESELSLINNNLTPLNVKKE